MAVTTNKKWRWGTPFEWGVVCAIVAIMAALLVPAYLQTPRAKGPHGAMFPKEEPQEENRIFHANGVSIIAPQNWDRIRDYSPESPLTITARGTPGKRLTSWIMIANIEPPKPASLEVLTHRTFQGFPAYERMQVEREGSFDDPARSHYELLIETPVGWWHVDFLVADAIRELPPQIKQYIDTIQFPKEASTATPE